MHAPTASRRSCEAEVSRLINTTAMQSMGGETMQTSSTTLSSHHYSTSCATATTLPSSLPHRAVRTRSRGTSPPTVRDETVGRQLCASAKRSSAVKEVPAQHRRELRRANEITRRTAVLLTAAFRAGAQFILENPADRGDKENELLYQVEEHGPIWLDPHVQALRNSCGAESVTFAQCMFGADVQKYTTLLFTAGLAPMLRPLHQMVCSHAPGTHTMAGGAQRDDGSWNSAPSAAYPTDFNTFVCDALFAYIVGREASTVPVLSDADVADPGDTSPLPQGGLGAHEQLAPPAAPPRVEPMAPPPAVEP